MKIYNALSSRGLKNLPNGWHADGRGLYFVKDNGNGRWYFRKQVNHQRITIPIGSYPEVGLTDARKAIDLIKPSEAASKKKTIPFKRVVAEAIDNTAVVKLWSSPEVAKAAWNNCIKKYAFPLLENKPIDSITTQDIFNILSPYWLTLPAMASAVQQRLKVVFSYAVHMGYCTTNPAEWKGNLEFLLPSRSKTIKGEHHTAIKVSEIPRLFQALKADNRPISYAIMLGTLTATRANEFVLAEWEEFDFKTRIWSVPSKRRKDKRAEPFRVPITQQVYSVLMELGPSKGRIFTCYKKEPSAKLKRLGFNVTMHGMRSTFRDWGAELGKDPILMEKSLCHATGGAVQQAYQRSDCLEQRRPIMEEWGAYCFSKL